MSNVIAFKPSLLSPVIGEWVLDPLSVSRNKVMKKALGEEGLKKLWACPSIGDRAQCLAADPELARRYLAVASPGRESRMLITPQSITFNRAPIGAAPATTSVYSITRLAAEGRKIIAHTIDTRPGRQGHPIAYVFRMNKQWLLVSEQYFGREAIYFPRSPVHRYYAAG